MIKRANQISAKAFQKAARFIRPGKPEYQVQAVFEKELSFQGLPHTAFPSIVASGENSSILHYTHNRRMLKSGDLLLIDAGGEYHGYAADITRTYPVSGKFSPGEGVSPFFPAGRDSRSQKMTGKVKTV